MLSAPASIPITTVATFASLFAPTDPGSRRPLASGFHAARILVADARA